MLLLGEGQVRLAGDIDDLLAAHRLLTGPGTANAADLAPHSLVENRTTGRQTIALVHTTGPFDGAGWLVDAPTLEELVLAYLRSPAAPAVSLTERVPA